MSQVVAEEQLKEFQPTRGAAGYGGGGKGGHNPTSAENE